MSDFQRFAHLVWYHSSGVQIRVLHPYLGFRCAAPQAKGFHPCGVWHKHIADIDKSGVIPAYPNSVVLPISEGGKDSCDNSADYSCHESFPPDWKGDKAKTGKGGNDSCPGWVGCVQQQIDYNIYEVKEML